MRRGWPTPPAWWLRGPAACIERFESTDGRGSRNLYGMQAGWAQVGGTGWAGAAPPAEQRYRAWLLYRWSLAKYGNGWLPLTTRRDCGL